MDVLVGKLREQLASEQENGKHLNDYIVNIHNFLKVCGLKDKSEAYVEERRQEGGGRSFGDRGAGASSGVTEQQLEMLTSVEYAVLASA